MAHKKHGRVSPARIILFSVLGTIITGTLLLALPWARTAYISWLDIFFTATSATCVTGALVVPMSYFSTFGHFIILLLMQIGGLGLITMSLFMISLFFELGLGTQLMAGEILELESWKNIQKTLFFIIFFTLIIEFIGALFIFFELPPQFSFAKACFYAAFHAVSFFCSAGFSLFPEGFEAFKHNISILITCSALMFCGGLGFLTWHELILYAKSVIHKKRFHFSLQTKIIFITTITLFVAPAALIWMLERTTLLSNLTFLETVSNIIFNAISIRSTGVLTFNILELQVATLFLIMIVCFIGSSPGSTGSGIKSTTFAIFWATIKSAILGHATVKVKGRQIAKDQVYKALAIISLSVGWIMLIIFCTLISEKSFSFLEVCFEVVSAFATLGSSLGVTHALSVFGKVCIIASMIIGRIGSLTILLALKKKTEPAEFAYPEERIMLG